MLAERATPFRMYLVLSYSVFWALNKQRNRAHKKLKADAAHKNASNQANQLHNRKQAEATSDLRKEDKADTPRASAFAEFPQAHQGRGEK